MSIRSTILADSVNFPNLFCNNYAAERQHFPRTRRHTTFRELAAIVEDIDTVYTWATIRDPFSWFHSGYSQLIHWRESVLAAGLLRSVEASASWRAVAHQLAQGFPGWIYSQQHIREAGGIVRYWCADVDGNVAAQVVRLEDLGPQWPHIYPKLNPRTPYTFTTPPTPGLLRVNHVPPAPVVWTPDLVRTVREWCAFDFANYYPHTEDPG